MSIPFANAYDELLWRGSIYDITAGAQDVLRREKITCYNGFDPTATSLHIGNMVPVLGLVRLQRHGHTPIVVVGGGTGMIGDPGGRADERALLDVAQVERNTDLIRAQLEQFLDFGAKNNPAMMVNNADWLLDLRLVEFLRDVGKHLSVNYMTAKESVKSRLDRDSGISYTEFSYMLLQAYDFLRLYDDYGCTFQMGGSDQWGNILAGVELIRRVHGIEAMEADSGKGRAHALVYPLITTASGEKFGKSIGGAPSINPDETSPYRMYQFFLNTADADVISYLKTFTDVTPGELPELEHGVEAEPQKRTAQRRLARDITLLLHGRSGLDQAERVTRALFGGDVRDLSASEIEDGFEGAPGGFVAKHEIDNAAVTLQSVAVDQELCSSAGEARRLVKQGGLYLNGVRVDDSRRPVSVNDLIDGRVFVLRRGSKDHRLMRVR